MQPELLIGAFTGFIESLPNLASDFIHGGETGIKGTPRNDSRDWRPEIPTPKSQLMKVRGISYGDTNGCLSFSLTNDIASQMDWLIAHGQINADGENFLRTNGYIDELGKVNLSPRFTATMSGTDPKKGNTLTKVWDSARNHGLVPDIDWPMPTEDFAKALDAGGGLERLWSVYYSPVPDTVKAVGQEFRKWFDIKYEWVAWPGGGAQRPADFAKLLEVAPVQIATAVCPGWNSSAPIMACGSGSAHATAMLCVESSGTYDVLDHYVPFLKKFSSDYNITYGIRGVITQKKPAYLSAPEKPVAFIYDYQVSLALGDPQNADVEALQHGLQILMRKDGKSYYMKPGVFGPFGPQTQKALAQFQIDHGIDDEPDGAHFGPKSRAALTQALIDAAKK